MVLHLLAHLRLANIPLVSVHNCFMNVITQVQYILQYIPPVGNHHADKLDHR